KATAGTTSAGPLRTAVPGSTSAALTSVPVATLVEAATQVRGLQPAVGADGSRLSAGGKPQVLYIGAEFCPVCAAERWPMTVALSQFGTFSHLSQTHSAVRDGNLPTLSFYGSSYSSPYLTFTPVEMMTNQASGGSYGKLESPTPQEMAAWQGVQGQNLTFPFLDIGGQWVLQTSQFPSRILQDHTFSDVASSIGRNDTTIGSAVDASAATLVKYFCSVTGQQPAPVCTAVASVQTGGATSPGPSSPAG
ncbi:MAG TPA: DUF929 family protein, partial [Acidimicrobiales bacterium]|nr:DUF929 family protein [Acidimicrobiales bacterium]